MLGSISGSAGESNGWDDGDGIGSAVNNSPFLVVSTPPDIVTSPRKYSWLLRRSKSSPSADVNFRNAQFSRAHGNPLGTIFLPWRALAVCEVSVRSRLVICHSERKRGISQSKRGSQNLNSVINHLVGDPSLRSG